MKGLHLLILTLLLNQAILKAQISDSISKIIDGIYFQDQSKPGWLIGVVRNDTLIYKKAGGIANLEYNIKNTAETIFHVASNSKQFTAYCVILLASIGKLSLDDDVRKYLNWIPEYKDKITIRNLLNHTSGIRDYWQLEGISGVYSDDVTNQENIVELLRNQKDLNFLPGEEYLYSNSNYIILAEIIKSVSGKTFRQFSDSAIFKPLKMKNTFFNDDLEEIVPNRAYSYYKNEKSNFNKFPYNSSTVGPTGLLSNVEDLSKWIVNFYKPIVGGEKEIKALTTKGKLNNGEQLEYGGGLIISDFMGWDTFFHNGNDAGYNSFIAVFPDKKLGFILLSNSKELNPMMNANKLIELFLRENPVKVKIQNTFDQIPYVLKDSTIYNRFIGDYISKSGYPASIKKIDGKLKLNIFGVECLLKQINADTFRLQYFNSAKIILNTKSKNGRPPIEIQNISNTHQELIKVNYNFKLNEKDLTKYVGDFYSPELDCHYKIILKNGELYLTHRRLQDFKLQPISEDHLLNDSGHMSHLTMIRDKEKKIIGFEVNNGRVLKLRFNRQN